MDRGSGKSFQFLVLIILLLLFMEAGRAQGIDTLMLRRDYQHVRFDAFASDLEKEFGIRIFYEKDWVKDVDVDIPQAGFSISEATAIEFFTSDVSGPYNLVIEGFTSDGFPLRTEFPFRVEKMKSEDR
jgi:hypothetical protein